MEAYIAILGAPKLLFYKANSDLQMKKKLDKTAPKTRGKNEPFSFVVDVGNSHTVLGIFKGDKDYE